MNGRKLVTQLKMAFCGDIDASDTALAKKLGYTSANIANLAKGATERRLVNLVRRAIKSAEGSAITTIVEFFDLAPDESSQGKKMELFSPSIAKVHPYLKGLRRELEGNHGIYIFYDSRGRALYAGKAEKRVLWDEIKNAFNRDRDVQKIKRVAHPQRRTAFRRSDEKRRQIVSESVPLHELAFYLSAYATPKELIGPLEALLVRGFANDLLNVRMEHITKRRAKGRRKA